MGLRRLFLLCMLIFAALVFFVRNTSPNLQRRHRSSNFFHMFQENDFHHQSYCDVDCKVGSPCSYNDEVDFRIMVLTFDRPLSLIKCLESFSKIDTLGKLVSVDIWIDRSMEGEIDQQVIESAEIFQQVWVAGRVCIHQRERNAFLDGQWIDSWQPKPNTKEIALFVEDDTDISKHTLRWLMLVHNEYDHMKDIAGYTLKMQLIRFFRGDKGALVGPKTDNVMQYGLMGPWGYSPHAERWREFQEWFHTKNDSLKPYVPDVLPTTWYKQMEEEGVEKNQWTMWHHYFCYINKYYTFFPNLHVKYDRDDLLLSFNRQEKGFHYDGHNAVSDTNYTALMANWRDQYGVFPKKPVRYSYEGHILQY